MELRGLVGVMGRTGQGSVLLPWLLKPEVAVEEGEKPPLTRAERKHASKGWYSKILTHHSQQHYWNVQQKEETSVGVNLLEKRFNNHAEEKAPAVVSCQQQCCHK